MHAKPKTLQSFKNLLDKICFVEYENDTFYFYMLSVLVVE